MGAGLNVPINHEHFVKLIGSKEKAKQWHK